MSIMKQISVVGLLLALCPFAIPESSPIRVALRKYAPSLKSTLKSSSEISVDNSSSIFFGTMTLGTPQQSFTFAFDTTSNLVWIPGTNCTDCGNSVNEFNSSASSTFVILSSTQTVTSFNEFGQVMYETCNDTLGVSGLNATNQTFGYATSLGTTLSGIDGLAGLGPGSFISNLLSQNNLTNVFSLYIDPSSSGVDAGSIILGGTEDSTESSIVTVSSASNSQWQLAIQSIAVGSSSFDCDSCYGEISILGTPNITGPKVSIQAIYTALGANSTGYVNKSDDLSSVAFQIGGSYLNITSSEYLGSCDDGVCATRFVVDDTAESNFVLGTVFVRKYLWEFNMTSNEITISDNDNGSSAIQPGFSILVSLIWAWLYLEKKYFN